MANNLRTLSVGRAEKIKKCHVQGIRRLLLDIFSGAGHGSCAGDEDERAMMGEKTKNDVNKNWEIK